MRCAPAPACRSPACCRSRSRRRACYDACCKPRTPAHAAEPLPVARAARRGRSLAADVRQRLAGARILLVEDHPLNQELACELLRRAGMEVVVADNGQDALERLADAGPFDGVLMDCQMPVMDGYTATRRAARATRAWQRLPVIAMTASALAEDRDRALASGMNAHITKPIDVERCCARCRSGSPRAARAARRRRPHAPPVRPERPGRARR